MSKSDPTGLDDNYTSSQAQAAASDAQEENTAGPLNIGAAAQADARAAGLQTAGLIAQATGHSGEVGGASWGGSSGTTFTPKGSSTPITLPVALAVSAAVSGMNGSSSLHGPEVAYLPGGHDVSPGTAEKVVSSAKSWEGTPYPVPDDAKPGDYGGVNATKGFGGDCSGSQHAIANEAGIPIGYAKAGAYGALAATPGTPIRALSRNELANPQPGDVLHFSYPFNHVATAVGDGTMETAHSARANQRGQYYSNTPVAAFGVPDAGYRYQQ